MNGVGDEDGFDGLVDLGRYEESGLAEKGLYYYC